MANFFIGMKLYMITAVAFMFGTSFCESAPWVYELNRLDDLIEKEYKKQYGVELEGTGGGGIMGFNRYSPQFKKYSPTNESEARKLVFTMAEDLLKKVNHNPILVKEMISYPFTPKNLGFTIFFRKPDGNFVENGEISCIYVNEEYVTYGYKTDLYNPSIWREEPIREALEKIEGSRQKFPFIWECVEEQEGKKDG